jgi:hypothetical protein
VAGQAGGPGGVAGSEGSRVGSLERLRLEAARGWLRDALFLCSTCARAGLDFVGGGCALWRMSVPSFYGYFIIHFLLFLLWFFSLATRHSPRSFSSIASNCQAVTNPAQPAGRLHTTKEHNTQPQTLADLLACCLFRIPSGYSSTL